MSRRLLWFCCAPLWAQESGAELAARIERESHEQLLRVRRVFVDRLLGGDTASQMRDMLIGSLQAARIFVLTENADRADAFLRGSAEDLVFTDVFQSSEGVNARLGVGGSNGRASQGRSALGLVATVGEQESLRIAERKHEAAASVRLVNKDGDVIWATTKESQGGKFRGASADVADRVAKQLIEDLEKARRAQAASH